MSGGAFDYKQYLFDYVADAIEEAIRSNDDLSLDSFGDIKGRRYSSTVIKKMRDAVYFCRLAAVYAQRVDWLLSGDDSESTFLNRLTEDLIEFQDQQNPDL